LFLFGLYSEVPNLISDLKKSPAIFNFDYNTALESMTATEILDQMQLNNKYNSYFNFSLARRKYDDISLVQSLKDETIKRKSKKFHPGFLIISLFPLVILLLLQYIFYGSINPFYMFKIHRKNR